MRRNLNYYLKKPVDIPYEYLCFFRYEFEPIIKKNSFVSVIRCMLWLRYISKKIIRHPNFNNINNNTVISYRNKRYFTLLFIKPHLSKFKWLLLIIISGDFLFLLNMVKKRIPMRTRKKSFSF